MSAAVTETIAELREAFRKQRMLEQESALVSDYLDGVAYRSHMRLHERLEEIAILLRKIVKGK